MSLSRWSRFLLCTSALAAAAVLVASTCHNKSLYSLANATSWSVPAHFQSFEATAKLNCPLLCKFRPTVCFGFYLLKSSLVCRLFNASSFFNRTSWMLSWEQVDIYTIDTTVELPLRVSGCNQSSVVYGGVCERGLDGNTNGIYMAGGSCTHTANEPNPWWEVQLAQVSRILAVRIYNRQDCCSGKLNKFTLLVDGVECARVDRSHSFSILTLNCSLFGSRVKIASQLDLALTLCKVELFGSSL